MYAGQFHQSSTLPLASHGSFLPAGFSVGFGYAYRFSDFLEGFVRARHRRAKLCLGLAGESLEGWTYFGGWRSPPLPHDVYYHAQSTFMDMGLRLLLGKSAEMIQTYIGGSLAAGAYVLNLGSKDRRWTYSDVVTGGGVGYLISAGVNFPIKSQGIVLFIPSLFVEYGGLQVRQVSISDYIWQGVTHTISEQAFAFQGFCIGLELKTTL